MKRLISILAISILFSTASFAANNACEQLVGTWHGEYVINAGGLVLGHDFIPQFILNKTEDPTKYAGSLAYYDEGKIINDPVTVICSNGKVQITIEDKDDGLLTSSNAQLFDSQLNFTMLVINEYGTANTTFNLQK